MKKPRANDLRYGYYNSARDFIEGILSEDEYIKKHHDSIDRNTLPWDELYLLQSNMEDYRNYLLRFSLYNRRLVLLNEEIIRFSQQDLYLKFGVSFDLIRKFIGKKDENPRTKIVKATIREVLPGYGSQIELAAYISVLTRVPFEWLKFENPSMSWTTDYFLLLKDPLMNRDEFLNLIKSLPEDIHDVRGIILEVGNNARLYIRFEWIKGAFIIELFNPNSTYSQFDSLIRILTEYKLDYGLAQTVIPSQRNFVIFCQNKSRKSICLTFPIMHF